MLGDTPHLASDSSTPWPPAGTWPLSILLGGLVELLLASCWAASDFSPSGPDNPVGLIGTLGHLFPGLTLGRALAQVWSLGANGSILGALVVQTAFWVVMAWLSLGALRIRHRA